MNVEIIRELARQWQLEAETPPMSIGPPPNDGMGATYAADIGEMKKEEFQREIYKKCANDLKDVIRIYHDFKHSR